MKRCYFFKTSSGKKHGESSAASIGGVPGREFAKNEKSRICGPKPRGQEAPRSGGRAGNMAKRPCVLAGGLAKWPGKFLPRSNHYAILDSRGLRLGLGGPGTF